MYSIGEVSRQTGISAYTLRYYEKIGLLPNPQRQHGNKHGTRRYSDADLQFIHFIHGLKQTGMKLGDIATFMEDGCLLTQADRVIDVNRTLGKRIDILDRHIEQLEQQLKQLQTVKGIAQEKGTFYADMLKSRTDQLSNDTR